MNSTTQKSFYVLILAISLLWLSAAGSLPASAAEPGAPSLDAMYGNLPLSFEANMGQADPSVGFVARGRGYGILVTRAQAVLVLRRPIAAADGKRRAAIRSKFGAGAAEVERTTVRVRVVGSNADAGLRGAQLLPGKANYFHGKDPAKWRTDIPTYARVEQPGVYPGIDLVYYGNQRELESDFVVAPGADLSRIRLAYDGVDGIAVDSGGDLVLQTRLGEIRQHSPVVYQEIDGVIRKVPAAQVVTGQNEVGFQVRDYDASRPLIIDPTISYGTLLGGSYVEDGLSIAVDSSGSAYVCGLTDSFVDFPVTLGAVQPISRNLQYSSAPEDAFVTKLNPTGTALVYSSYLGGDDGDSEADAIAVDSAGNAYLGGWTTTYHFPVTASAFQSTTTDVCCQDAWVTKLNPSGSALLYSTLLYGNDHDVVSSLAVDSSGNVYATGTTYSTDFPTIPSAFQTSNHGSSEAFVTKLNTNASGAASLVYSTYVGGIGQDEGIALALDSSGSAYVTGVTASVNFPVTAGGYLSPSSGGKDAFLVKVNPAGSALAYSARLSGSGDDVGWGVAVDAQGNAYVAGRTMSSDFPVTAGAYQTTTHAGDNEIFVSKLNPAGSSLIYSTFLGGSGSDVPYGIVLDSKGYVYLTGITSSTDFPTTTGALSRVLAGASDGFVAQLNDTGTSLLSSTYLGGSGDDEGDQIALDPNGNAYITGFTDSSNFPVSPGSYQTALRGPGDAFIVKMNFSAPPPPAPPVLSIISGNNQSAPANTALPGPLVVVVTQSGSPVAGVTVTFSPTNATVNAGTVLTDAAGRAQTTVTLGSTVGTATISVSVTGAAPLVFTATVQAPGPATIAVTSAASFAAPPVAPGMIAVIWWGSGSNFTAVTQHASLPLPTSMGGVSATIKDSSGAQNLMPLFDVSPRQLNVLIPDATQGGTATITVTGSDGLLHTGTVAIESVAPGLFSATANGQGFAVGQTWNVKADGTSTITSLCCTTNAQGQQVGIPIDMGAATDTTLVVVYGTGLRGLTRLANASATAGGQTAVVDYAGLQGSFVGLDQVNITLPNGLRGQGTVPISLTLDSKTANALNIVMAGTVSTPALTSIWPTSGQAGQTIGFFTINGSNLTGGQVAWDNSAGLTLSNISVGAASITATLAIASNVVTGARSVWVTTAGGPSNHVTFTITAPAAPSIASISPTSANPGQTVTNFTLNGSNLTGGQVAWDNSAGLTLSNVSVGAASITATLAIASNAATGGRSLWVTTAGGQSNHVTFTIAVPPVPSITSVNPTSGNLGQTIATFTVNGTNLSRVTAIEFTPASGITITNLAAASTSVTAQVAIAASAASGSRNVDVVSPEGRSNTVAFTINGAINAAGYWQFTTYSSIYPITTTLTGRITQIGNSLSGTLNVSGSIICATTASFVGTLSGNSMTISLNESDQIVAGIGTLSADGGSASGAYQAPYGGCTDGDYGTWYGTRTSP
jgi:uncharacterized protein (TIGR03437 family)